MGQHIPIERTYKIVILHRWDGGHERLTLPAELDLNPNYTVADMNRGIEMVFGYERHDIASNVYHFHQQGERVLRW